MLPSYEEELFPLWVVTSAGLRWFDCEEDDTPVRPADGAGRLDETEPLLVLPDAGLVTFPAGLAATLSVLVDGVVLVTVVLPAAVALPDEGFLVTEVV